MNTKNKRTMRDKEYIKSSSDQAREVTFNETMNLVRHQLRRSNRPFSQFIHRKKIEEISELLGKTLFRPNAILAGGLTAFIVVLIIYNYARYTGFALQGSETIVTFTIGWMIGLLYDVIRAILFRKDRD